MPKHKIPCPSCQGAIKVRKSGPLLAEDRTGLLVRECLVECTGCQRRGKMLVSIDIGLYLDDDGLHVDQTPLPVQTAA